MILKYAGDILADVNKVYVIKITYQGVWSFTFPVFYGTTFTNHYWTQHAHALFSLTPILKSTTCSGMYFSVCYLMTLIC